MVWRSRVGDNLDTARTTVATTSRAFPPLRGLCLPMASTFISQISQSPEAPRHAEGRGWGRAVLCVRKQAVGTREVRGKKRGRALLFDHVLVDHGRDDGQGDDIPGHGQDLRDLFVLERRRVSGQPGWGQG